jgi:glycerol kinase
MSAENSANPLIMALDQGTTSSRAMVFNSSGDVVSVAQQEFPQIYPEDGWVEHNPADIWNSTLSTAQQAIKQAESAGGRVVAIGITNQRETTIIWDRITGEPIANAIVWQDRRTSKTCQQLVNQGAADMVQERTGLLLDPYFSATKIAWLLDNTEGAREKCALGELAFGTVDSFLIHKLTGGTVHATDATNASRTSLFNIRTQQWDADLLTLFNIPESVLPEVKDCAADYGDTDPEWFGRAIPILGVAGDQQAAAIGQGCFNKGDIKSTYGTGCFVLLNCGDEIVRSKNRLLTTVAYRFNGKTTYALEGSIFVAGAAIQWLRDGLELFSNAKESESLACGISDTGGVYLVPAFTGLGAPHWDADARGAIYGLTRDSGIAEITRAALESVCYQTDDLLQAMQADGVTPSMLKVDGGMVANDWLCQYLADIVNLPIQRPALMETTALGAAYLAGLQAGVFGSLGTIASSWRCEHLFTPAMMDDYRQQKLTEWRLAVQRTLWQGD